MKLTVIDDYIVVESENKAVVFYFTTQYPIAFYDHGIIMLPEHIMNRSSGASSEADQRAISDLRPFLQGFFRTTKIKEVADDYEMYLAD